MGTPSYLVVVLPGIGGSVLRVPGTHGRLVWAARFGDVGNLLLDPEGLSVDKHPRLAPAGLISTQKAFGIWTAIQGYETVLTALTQGQNALPHASLDRGTSPMACMDATVVAVGYDFRLGVKDAADELDRQLQPRVEHLWPNADERRDRVFIVAHSMGGLVAREWAAREPNRELCRMILTLGTPHRGAPKALQVLTQGLPILGQVQNQRLLDVVRSWPSVYDLLPQFPAVADVSTAGVAVVGRRSHELPIDWLRNQAARAHSLHEDITQCWSDPSWETKPRLNARIGYGHSTLRGAVWDGKKVHVGKHSFVGLDLKGWDDLLGDGTIPASCAVPFEHDEDQPDGLLERERHGRLNGLASIPDWLRHSLRFPRLSNLAIRGVDKPIVLGVEVEPVVLTRTSNPIAAMLHGSSASVSVEGARVSAFVRPAQQPYAPAVEVMLEWDSATAQFTGMMPALSPGLHDLEVVGEGVHGAGGVQTTRELVEVVDGDALG